jgi:predicted Rossmann-fold nucleotide-binding protein
VAGFFDPLLAWVDQAVKEGFVRPQHRQLFIVSDDPSILLEKLVFHEPPQGFVKLAGEVDLGENGDWRVEIAPAVRRRKLCPLSLQALSPTTI